ncbi:MAG: hypothetical protein ACE5HU_05310, partial [Acidobacteriota bacterium]
MPEARRIGTLYDPHRMGRSMRELREAAERSGLELVAENVRGGLTGGIEGALSELGRQDLDAFLLLLDPEVLDTRRFAEILDLVRRQDLLLVVPDASLAVSGKSLQIAPGFWQLGAYSGMLIRRILEGEVQPSQIGMTYPETITLAGNPVMSHPPTPADVLPGGRPSRAVRLALED